MKKTISIFVLSAFITAMTVSRSYSYLTIDTNKIIENPSMTNIESKSIIESELPNSYLSSGIIQTEPPRDPGRRFDVVFFVSIPVTYYLLLNIMQLKNMYFFQSRLLDNADWTYIYLNTFFLPLAVAYFDYQYIEKEMKYREEMAYNQYKRPDFFAFKLPVLSFRF